MPTMPNSPDPLAQLQVVLFEVILPNLQAIQANQGEQRLHSDGLALAIESFRAEMQLRLGEIRAEIAYCRREVEEALTRLNEYEAQEESRKFQKKAQIH